MRRTKHDTSGGRASSGPLTVLRDVLRSVLIAAMVAQPVMAQTASIAVDHTGAGNTSLDQTASGVTSVNIATPNTTGLSHNRYTQFDVGPGGVILNNATQELSASQLGGLMQGNGNLAASGAARVILNEVTSANRSLLEGAVEVHGVSADVILANPNGITCNGCGVINTPRVTLTTGVAQVGADGALSGFDVQGGDVLIGSRGADLRSSAIFDIVSRKISVQGAVAAGGDLNLTAGRNSYDYATGSATSLGSDGADPAIAIDSSLLGGMYAGPITLVSTDAGSGVNMQGQMASNAGQMVLTADGQLVMGEARATGRVQAGSVTRAVRVERTIFTDDAVVLEGATGVEIANAALVAATGDVSLSGPNLTLGPGAIAASGVLSTGAQTPAGTLSLTGTTITGGEGQLVAGAQVRLAAAQIDLSRAVEDASDTIRALGDLSITAQNVTATNGRVRVGQMATLRGQADLTLTGGTYQAAGGLLAEAAHLTTSAQLGTSGLARVRATAGALSNTGRIAGDAGSVLTATGDLTNAGIAVSSAGVTLQAGETLRNTASGQIAGGDGVSVTAAALDNAGTISAEGGDVLMATTGTLSNRGTILSQGATTLRADDTLRNTGEISTATALVIRGQSGPSSGAVSNAGLLNASEATFTVASLENNGTLSAVGTGVNVSATGNVGNTGTFEAKSELRLGVDGTVTNSGRIEAVGTVTIGGASGDAGGAITNQAPGVIKAGDTLGLRSASLANSGAFGAADGAVTAELDGDLANTGLIYAGTEARLRAEGTISNTSADILAEQSLIIEGLTAARATALRNISGNIEAVAGDLTINAGLVETARLASVFDATPVVTNTASGNPSITPDEGVTHHYQTTATTTTTESVTHRGAASKLLAGRDVQIEANDLSNSYSQIAAARDVTIGATTVTNTGHDLTRGVVNMITNRYITGYCAGRLLGWCYDVDERWSYASSSTSSSTSIGSVFGTIEAGGALNATATGYLSNNAVRGGATIAGLTSGNRAMDAAAIVATSSARSAVTLANLNMALADTLGRGALFRASTDPSMPYLVETRPEFVDPGKFLGSDYFLARVSNYDVDSTGRRFGDRFVETRLIQEQIFELTGQRQIESTLDPRGQIQALYDNGIQAQQSLGLVPGVALTPGQIAALTQDITWLETHTIQGEQVLTPRVYLTRATVANVDLAAGRITGAQADITAPQITNSGRIAARTGLDLRATVGLTNQGGDLFAGEDLTIDGGALFANLSGRVGAGNDLNIIAGQLVHDTGRTRTQTRTGFTDTALQRAALRAGGDLTLDISGDLTASGGVFEAAETLELRTGGTVDIGSLSLEDRQQAESRDTDLSTLRRANTLASLQAGGDLVLHSGGDTRLTGVAVDVGGGGDITAGGDIEIAAVQDEDSFNLSLDVQRRGLFGADSSVTQQSARTHTQRAVLEIGGDLAITSETGDVTLRSTRLESGGEVDLTATQGRVALRAVQDHDFERQAYRTEDLLWWSDEDKGSDVTTLEEVEILPGGGLRITAGTGIVVEYQPNGNLNAALDALTRSLSLAWMNDLRTNPDVDWQAVQTTMQTWDYESQGLTQAGALLVAAITSFATHGLTTGWAESLSGTLGATNASVKAAIEVGIKSLTTKSAVALVNSRGDLGAALQEITSDASLRSLITAMVSAGLTDAFIGATDLAGVDPKDLDAFETVSYKLQTGLISASVNVGVSTAIQGGDIGEQRIDGWTNAMVMAGLAGVQQRIGDFAETNGIDDGALSKVLAHAVAGGIAAQISGGDVADGALAAALAEVAGPLVGGGNLPPERQVELQRLIATAAVLIASDGDTDGATFSGSIAGAAHENNYLKHDETVLRARSRSKLETCEAEPGSCSPEKMAELQGTIAILDSLDAARDLEYRSACANPGALNCIAARSRYIEAQATFMDANRNSGDQQYLEEFGDIFSDIQAEFQSGLATDRAAMEAGVQRGVEFTARNLEALGVGAAGGAVVATAYFGGAALANCVANPICRTKVSVAVAEAAAGDALGGATLVPVVVAGKVALTHGDEVVGFIDEATGTFARNIDVPYDPRAVRQALEDAYGAQNLISTTIPPRNAPNVRFAGQEFRIDESTRVVFDDRGYPVFDDIAEFEVRFTATDYRLMSSTAQMRAATGALKAELFRNPTLRSQFNAQQLSVIERGQPRIPDLTWHHHQDTGRMQLVDSDIHGEVRHIGGDAMWEGR